jgi:hypothetical protein
MNENRQRIHYHDKPVVQRRLIDPEWNGNLEQINAKIIRRDRSQIYDTRRRIGKRTQPTERSRCGMGNLFISRSEIPIRRYTSAEAVTSCLRKHNHKPKMREHSSGYDLAGISVTARQVRYCSPMDRRWQLFTRDDNGKFTATEFALNTKLAIAGPLHCLPSTD